MMLELGMMTNSPGQCTLCGNVPMDETKEIKTPLPAIHAVGVDVNWGDDLYICWTCAGVVADLIDRPSTERWSRVRAAAKTHKSQNEELAERNKFLEEREEARQNSEKFDGVEAA